MRVLQKWMVAALALGTLSMLGACAQDVGDIDRTQPDLIKKSDLLDGEWYIRQTVSDVPATSQTWFEGFTFGTDRVVWQVTASALIGYRAYELNPGAETDVATVDNDIVDATGSQTENPTRDDVYYGEPLFHFDIINHVDVQRQYNSSTLEETNVIEENSSDRPWHEREYIRVNFQQNNISGYDFFGADSPTGEGALFTYVQEGSNPALAPEFDFDDEGVLQHLSVNQRIYAAPDIWTCIYFRFGIGIGECQGLEMGVNTSILRVTDDSYEPLTYDDRDMARFGYFRTERFSYDRRRGTTVTGQIDFANRHDIWVDSWRRDGEGNPLRDANGQRIAIPFAERTPEPIVYHMSPNFPEPLRLYAAQVAEGWDRSFRRAVAAAQTGTADDWESVTPMFVLCDNPITDVPVYPETGTAEGVCGTAGEPVRIGDLRYDVLWWVADPQQSGPLGYGPSAADPETGEIISGTAYVYGASVDTYAQWATDVIRFANGDLTPDDLQDPDYVRDQVLGNINPAVDPRAAQLALSPNLANIQLTDLQDVTQLMPEDAAARVNAIRDDIADGSIDRLRAGRAWETQRRDMIADSGFDLLALNDEQLFAFGVDPRGQVSDAEMERSRLSTYMLATDPDFEHSRHMAMHGDDCIMFGDHLDDSIFGIAEEYAGRTDYDTIYQEIRGLIFKAVMEHEVGHTIGLRHNFGASWDALNYHDEYWDLKIEGYPTVDESGNAIIREFGSPVTIADTYGIATLTPNQISGRMREYQYTSIMDYSSGFNTDFGGIGRYDDQAIMYAYTSGIDANANLEETDANFNQPEDGYVEAWTNPPAAARSIFTDQTTVFGDTYDEGRGIAYRGILEDFHYSTVVEQFGNTPAEMVENLFDRDLYKAAELELARQSDEPGRPIEVPYIFCSDEFRSTRQYCRVWDRGADPMEQTIDYIDRYRRYYYFDYYRRDRAGFMGLFLSEVGQRQYSRIFQPLVDGYQRWLLNAGFGYVTDGALSNQWTFAAYAGLNLLAEVVMTPNSGCFRFIDQSGEGEASYFDRVLCPEDGGNPSFDVRVEEGNGRLRYTQYEENDGYYFYQYPPQSGHYWTMVNAMIALTSSSTSVLGVTQQGAFDTTYSLPPYLVFEDEMTAFFNALALDDVSASAPLIEVLSDGPVFRQRPLITVGLNDGSIIDPETGATLPAELPITQGELDESLGNYIDTEINFSERITSMILGMTSFTSNYSARYLDQAKVWELSSGTVPNIAPGFEQVQFCDPLPEGTGKCFAALTPTGGSLTLGAEMVTRAQAVATEYTTAIEAGDTAAANDAQFEINDFVQDMEIMAALYEYFNNVI